MDPFTLIVMMLTLLPVGFLAALVGIGGGTIVVPLLTLVFHVDIKEAIATSSVTVVATGVTSASRYLKQGLTNVRLGIFLNASTVLGAIMGALFTLRAPPSVLYFAISILLLYVGFNQITTSRREVEKIESGGFARVSLDRLALLLGLSGSYYDKASRREVEYAVAKTSVGLLASIVAGFMSGMLGIGGGVLKVPIMNLIMNVPMKVAVATSKFMIGMTAATAACIYMEAGRVNPVLAAPIVLGITTGALLGTKVMNRVRADRLKVIFGAVLMYFGYLMLARALYTTLGVRLPGCLV